ncbi:MAG: hypothetical protein KAQ68_03830 [Clostridiales bacterium]|nr:hypothetical protein [Clostridiales bacterium]
MLKANEIKCVAVNLPVNLVLKLNECKKVTGKSKNTLLAEFIKTGIEKILK